eukprot:747394-Hanusia_phi.AAC.7
MACQPPQVGASDEAAGGNEVADETEWAAGPEGSPEEMRSREDLMLFILAARASATAFFCFMYTH